MISAERKSTGNIFMFTYLPENKETIANPIQIAHVQYYERVYFERVMQIFQPPLQSVHQ